MTWRAVLAGALTISAITTIGIAAVGSSTPKNDAAQVAPAAPAATPAAQPCTPIGYAGDGPLPVTLHIAKIGVNSSLVPLCLNPDRTVMVPPVDHPEQAGYYALGYRPGDKGSAVILGHVDGDRQLGVFHSLSRLTKGDKIVVDRADGSKVTFAVDKTETILKDDFNPAKVYGPAAQPELKLISCGGRYSKLADGYLANVITSAHLVK
jgi:LPXTG-site transpeptidase (sortase) family protein